jgi:hypothetical protein
MRFRLPGGERGGFEAGHGRLEFDRQELFCLTDGGGQSLMMLYCLRSLVVVADDRFSTEVRLQEEAGRTQRKERRLQLNREERCPEL